MHKRLSNKYRVIDQSYDKIENSSVVADAIKLAQGECERDKRKIVLLDVGGYFCKPILELGDRSHIAGVVEDTTFGHNRYQESLQDFPVAVYTVARSFLKEIEARYVGRDAVMAVDLALRETGVLMSGRRALVLGYGMIGTNVARSLRNHDMSVSVYDKYDVRNIQAFIDGYIIHKKRELVQAADIIFSATAETALTYEEMRECRSNAILASVGSKNTEFEVDGLRRHARAGKRISKSLEIFELPTSKSVILVKDGTAVNFLLNGTPKEVLDLVFSEITLCAARLSAGNGVPCKFNTIGLDSLSEISKSWLVSTNLA